MRLSWSSVLAVLVALAAPAGAEPSTPPSATPPMPERVTRPEEPAPAAAEPATTVALASNTPLGWKYGSIAASAYVALSSNVALRGNVAHYRNAGVLHTIGSAWAGAEPREYEGSITDVGAALVWYHRRVWDGLSLEAGALRRDRNTAHIRADERRTDTDSVTYGGRGMIGWSWLFGGRLFVAAAVGLSVGYETGRETVTFEDSSGMDTTERLGRQQIDGEAYLRMGLAF